MAHLEPIGVYLCNPNLTLAVEARLGNGQFGTIILVRPAAQVSDAPLARTLGLGATFTNEVLDFRATARQGNTPSQTALLTVDVYQIFPANPSAKVNLLSFGDSKLFDANGVARLMVSVMAV